MELLKFKKAMINEFVEFEYCPYRRKHAYSKDDFLKEQKEALERMEKSLQEKENEIKELNFQLFDLKGILKVAEKSTPNFGWESFIRGAIFGLGISVIILLTIHLIIK
jgi:predicted RNase H-like HicB family nuclease